MCQTLGIKMSVRTNSMTVIKRIFTQEIFTESVVAQHAVRVPVTAALSAAMPGFLPVHCIHQLLRSRVFSKHRHKCFLMLFTKKTLGHQVGPPPSHQYVAT